MARQSPNAGGGSVVPTETVLAADGRAVDGRAVDGMLFSIDSEITDDTRAVCRQFITHCLGDRNYINRDRQYRAATVASELLQNITNHGRRPTGTALHHPKGRFELRFQDGLVVIATEAAMTEEDFEAVRTALSDYSQTSKEMLAAQERAILLDDRRERTSSGMGLGLLIVVSDSDRVGITKLGTTGPHLRCRIEAVI